MVKNLPMYEPYPLVCEIPVIMDQITQKIRWKTMPMMPKTKAARMLVAKGFLYVARQQGGIFDTLKHKKDIIECASSPLAQCKMDRK